MIQVLPANPKGPNFLQSLMQGMGDAIPGAIEQYKQNKARQAEDASLEKNFGLKLQGVASPEMRKALINQLIDTEQEGFKQSNREQLARLKEDLKTERMNKLAAELGFDLSEGESRGNVGLDAPSSSPRPKGIYKDNDLDKEEPPFSKQQLIKGALSGNSSLSATQRALNQEWNTKKQHQEAEESKKFQSDRDYHSKYSDPILKEAEDVLKSAPVKRGLRAQVRRDIDSGETSGLIPYLVDKTGIEAFRNPESARFKTIMKNQFIEGLNSVGGGARPNQFIEQQLVSAQAALGRDKLSNQTAIDLDEFMDDMKEQRARYIAEIAKEDMETKGYVSKDVGLRADEKMQEYSQKRQDKMAYDIRKRTEDAMDNEKLMKEVFGGNIAKDTPLTLRTAALIMIKFHDDEKKAQAFAEKMGFRIPKE